MAASCPHQSAGWLAHARPKAPHSCFNTTSAFGKASSSGVAVAVAVVVAVAAAVVAAVAVSVALPCVRSFFVVVAVADF